MDAEEFAKVLMSEERKSWQDPDSILRELSVKRGDIIADLACGPGYFTIPLSKAVGKKGVIYAVDSNPVMLKILKKNLFSQAKSTFRNVKIVEADVTKTTRLPSGSADIVLFAQILHDLGDKTAFFWEVKRIAKTDAKFVDIDWYKLDEEFGPPREIRLSEGETKALARKNGLSFVRSIGAGLHHYGLVFKIEEYAARDKRNR
jgi:ubiquinone/menaquinone biosynthesis C-methylase UbiE